MLFRSVAWAFRPDNAEFIAERMDTSRILLDQETLFEGYWAVWSCDGARLRHFVSPSLRRIVTEMRRLRASSGAWGNKGSVPARPSTNSIRLPARPSASSTRRAAFARSADNS